MPFLNSWQDRLQLVDGRWAMLLIVLWQASLYCVQQSSMLARRSRSPALPCSALPPTCSCEATFQRPCARVLARDVVAVVRPQHLELLLHLAAHEDGSSTDGALLRPSGVSTCQ